MNKNNSLSIPVLIDLIVRFVALFFLFQWCYEILKPFFILLIWGCIIAIATYPIYARFNKLFGNRKYISVILLTILMLVVIILPGWLLFESIYEGINLLKSNLAAGMPLIPEPPAQTKDWPVILKPLLQIWDMASHNLDQLAIKYSSEITSVGTWILRLFTNIGIGILELILSIIISGFLLTYSETITKTMLTLSNKLAGRQGAYFFNMSVVTIRNVMKGVIGVAVIQTSLAAVGLFIGHVPYAGIWTLVCLILSIAQIGAGPVAIVSSIYMFSVNDSWTALLYSGWMLIVILSDNILKPILLGRKSPVPTIVVFLGSIGGFIYNGFIGLFLGAVILSLVYKLVLGWLETETIESE